MRKTLMVTLVLMASTGWSQAQDAGQTPSKTSGLPTIEGCLQTKNGQYILTENNGTVHLLSGYANKLKNYVDHQVEIAGKPGIRTVDTTGAGIASTAVEQKVFEVKTVKQTGATCQPATN